MSDERLGSLEQFDPHAQVTVTTHLHKCYTPGCGHMWQHPDRDFPDPEAHRCPRCGVEEYMKYDTRLSEEENRREREAYEGQRRLGESLLRAFIGIIANDDTV